MKKVCLFVLATLFIASSGRSATITENFAANPLQSGWQVFGDTNLFQWDSTNQNLDVTWDSSQSNSYFYLPLGTVLTRSNDFSISFDLELSNAPASGYGMELALGFLNLDEAEDTNFSRSTGYNSPDVVEFDYTPATIYSGATVWPAFCDTNSIINWNNDTEYDYTVYAPNLDDWYHVVMNYTASNLTMVTTMTNFEGTTGIEIEDPINLTNISEFYTSPFTDFRVNTFSISSYEDDGFGDSIYAQGAVANIVITLPPPPVQSLTGVLTNCVWQAKFCSQSNWLYELQRTRNFRSWTNVSPVTAGDATNLILLDTNPPPNQAFYRVNAFRP